MVVAASAPHAADHVHAPAPDAAEDAGDGARRNARAPTIPTAARPPWTTVRPFVLGLVSFAVLATLNQARGFDLWRNYALSGILLGGTTTWILWRRDVRLPHYIQWAIVAALLLHYGGGSLGSPDPFRMGLLNLHGVNGAYHEFTWWDNLTHAAGIGAGAMAIAYLVEAYQLRRGLGWSAGAVGAAAVVGALAAGVAVELYEYLGKSAFQTIDQGGYVNTMRDLQFNVLGTAVGATLAVVVDRRRLATTIAQHWGPPTASRAGEPWTRRFTPGLAGYLAFAALPAVATLVLAGRYMASGSPGDDAVHYEAALQTMLWCGVAGLALGPAVAWAGRRWRGRLP